MNTFTQSASNVAVRELNKSTTTNGAAAYKSTLCANLDFFSRSGNINYPNALHDFKLIEIPYTDENLITYDYIMQLAGY